MKRKLALLVGLALAGAAAAQMKDHDMKGMGGGTGMQQSAGGMGEGEVRKVDKDAGKLTIRHGAIPSMDMPAMTMVYRVKDPAVLDRLKPGDKVRFDMEKIGGQYTVTRIETGK